MRIINLVSTKEYADFIMELNKQALVYIITDHTKKGTTLIQVEIIVAYKLLTSHNNVRNTGVHDFVE